MPFVETWFAAMLAIVSATMATTAAAAAVSTWLMVRRHDRTLYGGEAIESERGLVHQVNENTEALQEVLDDG